MKPENRIDLRSVLYFLLLLTQLCWLGAASAQTPIPASTQFDITGFIQEATLDAACAADAHCGGTVKVNGHVVIVPKETIVIFPANALTWQELFAQAPLPWGTLGTAVNGSPAVAAGTASPATSGMASADCATNTSPCAAPPLTTWEVHVVGNRVTTTTPASDQYIAGLIYVSQQGLNSGAGFINFIDYALGEMRVGGTVVTDPATGTPLNQLDPLNPGARVRINDPVGRFTNPPALGSTDLRFTVDPDNPTIIAGTGYPMCLPRAAAGDPLCPEGNRPLATLAGTTGHATAIQMLAPNLVVTAGTLDPNFQAPLEVGDYITFAGTLVKDAPVGGFLAGDGPTVGPWPAPAVAPAVGGTAATYISAHTITNNVAIYTAPGTNPAYVMTEVALIGTGGLTVLGAGEAAVRTRFEGMTTDISPDPTTQRVIHLYGIDLTPVTGATSDRTWGTIGVDPGPPNGAVKGRWRFRPPCLPFGSVPAKPDKDCVMNAANTFLPPTREVRAVIEGAWVPGQTTTFANGIIAGQYHAPILEYIFPENIPGTPIVENNFTALDFLAKGGYTSSAGTTVGPLNPFPSVGAVVLPPPPPVALDLLTITSVEYRANKQRLIVTAADNLNPLTCVAPTCTTPASLSMVAHFATAPDAPAQPMTFDPVLGTYSVTVVGSSLPSTVTVTSTLGATATSGITRLR